jgi:hypothetical protein
MNARPRIRELNRISRDVGAQLRVEPDGFGSLPHSLIALLKELEIHVHHAEGERLFAEIDARVAELLNAAGLEGIVSKRLGAPYRSGPSRDWLKVKNPHSPAMVRHREERDLYQNHTASSR